MAGDTIITVVGNLVDDPELRFTPSGAPVANFRIASTPRTFDKQTQEWVDGDPLFLSCSIWRQAAENVAESLTKGMRVVVQGRLKQRQYETREGEKRTVVELDVDEIGPSLTFATAKVTRSTQGGQRSSGGQQRGHQQPAQQPQQQGGWPDTPQPGQAQQPQAPHPQQGQQQGQPQWGNPQPQGQPQQPWGAPGPGPNDEPPF